jgi:CrcB protein
MRELFCVGMGGFVGAVSRYYVSGWVDGWLFRKYGPEFSFFPLGTMVVNVLGCFLIGVLTVVAVEREGVSPEARMFMMTGFLGALTTFSTFGNETVQLFLKGSDARFAVLNVACSLALGIGAVLAGRWTAGLWGG